MPALGAMFTLLHALNRIEGLAGYHSPFLAVAYPNTRELSKVLYRKIDCFSNARKTIFGLETWPASTCATSSQSSTDNPLNRGQLLC